MSHNILQLISSSGFFGAENVVLELSTELKAAGHNVTVGLIENHRRPNLELIEKAAARSLGTHQFKCGGRLDMGTIRAIASYAREKRIDIIHSHGYKSNVYAVFSNLRGRRPLVATCHNWIVSNAKMGLYTKLDKLFLSRFNAVVSVSKTVSGLLREAGLSEERIVLIENGINISRFDVRKNGSGLRRELGVPDGATVIGTVGRLSKEKGHTFFLKMAQELLKEGRACTFIIVGDGPLRSSLEDEAKSRGISETVIFAGRRDDVPELLSIMDVFVLPSLTEGQPMALFEAMAAGKAVVATDAGDVPKIIGGGEFGVVVPSGDHGALAGGVASFLDDEARTRQAGFAARSEVARKYSAARMAAEYIRVYDRLHKGF